MATRAAKLALRGKALSDTGTVIGIVNNADATAITVDSSENVGIGTSSIMQNFGSNRTTLAIKGDGTDNYSVLEMGNGNSTAAGKYHGFVNFYNDTTSVSRIASISASNAVDANLTFFTAPSGGGIAERMRIDSSGNVGIGVTPEAHHSTHTSLQVGGHGNWTVGAPQTASQEMDFQHNAYYSAGGNDKYIITDEATKYRQGGGAHRWYVAPSGTADSAISWTTGLEVLNDGKARVPNGLLFGTDTAAANTLDDYEEGTFVPILRGSTSAGSFSTNGGNIGRYTKIGDVCTLNFTIAGTLSGATGSYTHFNLPFTVKTGTSATGSFSYVDTPNVNHVDFSCYVNAGQTLGYFIIKTASASTPVYPAPSSFMPSSVQIYGTVTYKVE